MTSAILVQCFYQLSYEATQIEQINLLGPRVPMKGMMNGRNACEVQLRDE